MSGLSVAVIVTLVMFGLAGGVGITAVGPGGVLPTIGLFALTSLPPDTIAGTALITHVATGSLGTIAYHRSGQLRDPATKATATTLAVAALVGTPIGVVVNSSISNRVFGFVLAVFAIVAAVSLWRRDSAPGPPGSGHPRVTTVAAVGFGVAVAAGIAGLGGPMLSVPVLAMLGVPMLEALAAGQAQSVVIAGVGSVGYAATGSVDWGLALLVGIPELVGVLAGWHIARSVPNEALERSLVVVLIALIPLLIIKA